MKQGQKVLSGKVGYTPGPWTCEGTTHKEGVIFSESARRSICSFDTKYHVNIKANAALIAAAPELLELLKDLSALRPFKDGEYKIMAERIEQAIARAEAR